MISVSSCGIYHVGHVQEFSPECASQCCWAGAWKNIPLDYVTVLLYLEELVWVAWRMANKREWLGRCGGQPFSRDVKNKLRQQEHSKIINESIGGTHPCWHCSILNVRGTVHYRETPDEVEKLHNRVSMHFSISRRLLGLGSKRDNLFSIPERLQSTMSMCTSSSSHNIRKTSQGD